MTKHDKKSTDPAHAEPTAPPHPDDVIVVPKGRSRRQFLFTLGLTIFVLVIFTVGSDFQSTMGGLFGGGGRNPVYLTWTDPLDGATHEVRRDAFDERFRVLKDFSYVGLFGSLHPTPGSSARPQPKPEDTALMLILEQLARDHGVDVSTDEFLDFLRGRFQDAAGVKAEAGYVRMPVPYFEAEIRRLQRCFKVLDVLQGAVLMAADPERIEDAWEEGHPQFRFEYLAVEPGDFLEAARSEVPGDEELLAWFHARPQWEQEKHFHEARYVLHAAWLPLESGWDATKLSERFPPAEGVDPDGQAQNYHRLYSNIRFKLPEPEDGSEPEKLYRDFEEVADVCRTEAPIQAALTNWLTDMRKRKSEEGAAPVDFLAEAAELGLETFRGEEALTKAEIEATAGWGGKNVAGRLHPKMAPETFVSTPVVEPGAMVVLWIHSITPPEEPPFAEIRDAVAEDWSSERAKALAIERLEGLRDRFGTRPVGEEGEEAEPWRPAATAEAFAEAAQSLDLAVHERPFLERGEKEFEQPLDPEADPAADPEADARAFDDFLAFLGGALFELEPGQVGAAQADLSGERVFLARLAEERQRPFADVRAKDLFGPLRGAALNGAIEDFREQVLRVDSPWFRTKFQVSLKHWERQAEEPEPEPEPAEE